MRRVGLLRKLLRGNVPIAPVVQSAFIQYGEKPVRKTKFNPEGEPETVEMLLPSYDEFISEYIQGRPGATPPLFVMEDISRRMQTGYSPKAAFRNWADWFTTRVGEVDETTSGIIEKAYYFVRSLGKQMKRTPYPREKDLWSVLGIVEATPEDEPVPTNPPLPTTLEAVSRALSDMAAYDPNGDIADPESPPPPEEEEEFDVTPIWPRITARR